MSFYFYNTNNDRTNAIIIIADNFNNPRRNPWCLSLTHPCSNLLNKFVSLALTV